MSIRDDQLSTLSSMRSRPVTPRWTLPRLSSRAISEARTADHAFSLQTEVGDRALYLAGVFPDRIYHRYRYGRRPVDLEWYEDMGRRYYAAAARHEAAARYELADVLELLAEAFVALRQALNDLVDEHLHLAPRPESVDRLCRQALYRPSP